MLSQAFSVKPCDQWKLQNPTGEHHRCLSINFKMQDYTSLCLLFSAKHVTMVFCRIVSRTGWCPILHQKQVQWALQCWWSGDLQLFWWQYWNHDMSDQQGLDKKTNMFRWDLSPGQSNFCETLRHTGKSSNEMQVLIAMSAISAISCLWVCCKIVLMKQVKASASDKICPKFFLLTIG